MKPIPLSLLQQRFKELLVSANPNLAAAREIGVLDEPPLSVEQRVGIYNYAYITRIKEALEEDFPILHDKLGCETFRDAVRAYLDQQPSRSADLSEISWDFPEFIESHLREIPAYATDLAKLERFMAFSWLAPQPIAFDFEKLASLSADEQQNIILELGPSVFLFESAWTVHEIVETPTDLIPRQERTLLAVYCQDSEVQTLALSENQWTLLQEISRHRSLGDINASLSSGGITESEIATWFSDWVAKGIISKFNLGATSP